MAEKRVTQRIVEVDSPISRLDQIIYFVVGVVEIILLFRLILRLFGASTLSNFVRFIYDISAPLVAPFFGIFQTDIQLEVGRLEPETIVAMLVYMVIGYLLIGLMEIMRPSRSR